MPMAGWLHGRGRTRKRGDNFFPEQFDRSVDQVRWHAPDEVVGAEDVVAHFLLAFLQPSNVRLGTTDQRQAVLNVEFVAEREVQCAHVVSELEAGENLLGY